MLSIGQYCTDIHTGKVVKIIGSQQVFGMFTDMNREMFAAIRRKMEP